MHGDIWPTHATVCVVGGCVYKAQEKRGVQNIRTSYRVTTMWTAILRGVKPLTGLKAMSCTCCVAEVIGSSCCVAEVIGSSSQKSQATEYCSLYNISNWHAA